ncbi:lipopolysaccharide biosynthesis protein [Citromicrobium bathyomarinum]|uniref:lipopolysaccharide biosynthesis protein n=2 Tax=Sphingomonadaceae TaxID=41297 RepID=UPI00315A52E6
MADIMSFTDTVRSAVAWRSGGQIVAQIITWSVTLAVVRILDPADYGLFAMGQVVVTFLAFLNGYGFASALIQREEIDRRIVQQTFGMLILVNAAIAATQFALAPVAAAYYGQPMVADLLRLQTLIFIAIPFIAIPEVLLMRALDFKRHAVVNVIAAIVSAGVALVLALLGFGVWTLIWAPIALLFVRAVGLTIAARSLVWPSFDFRGSGNLFTYGSWLLASHLCWTVATQADIFLAGRAFDPHQVGLYSEAIFLVTIVTARFIPPLNDVAFPSFARLQSDREALARGFLTAIRLIVLVVSPIFLGMNATAEPLVLTAFGPKWTEMAPIVGTLALAMPAFTIYILFAPAFNAIDRPDLSAKTSAVVTAILVGAFLIGLPHGISGLAWAWVLASPLLPLTVLTMGGRALGITASGLLGAITPGLGAACGMALVVRALAAALPDLPAPLELAVLVPTGALAYLGIVYVLRRDMLLELFRLVVRKQPPAVASA